MMLKVYKYLLFTLEMLFSLIFLIFTIMFTISSIHNIKMTEEVKKFIDSAKFEYKDNDNDIYYYVVETTNLDTPVLNIEKSYYNTPTLGNTGDIFLMPQSRMDYIPFFAQFVSTLFGGHAGVVIDGGERIIEAMGGTAAEAYVFKNNNDSFSEERTVIGMRVNASLEERERAAENAKTLVGKGYNYLYIFNTLNSYYCTDVCSRVYGKEFGMNYNIDTNGFHVSVQDLFRSNDTYITFVKYKIGNETHIYYLKNVN